MKSEYLNIAELLHNADLVMVVELLSQRTYVRNLKSKYFDIAELLHTALVVRVAGLLSQGRYVPNVQ